MDIFTIKVKDSYGKEFLLEELKNKVLLIVNTASKCGLTPQYKELEEIYKEIGNEYFEILGFPCNQFANQEPGTNDEIVSFCQLNYGVSFPIMEKVDVNGENAHPLFKYLTENSPGLLGKSIKWNFTKFLIDGNGKIIDRFAPTTNPSKIKPKIIELIRETENANI